MVQFAAVFQSVLVEPFQVAVTSIKVTVGSLAPPTLGSSVRTLAKLLPETVPCVLTCLSSGGVFTVAEYLIVMLFVAGKVPIVTLTNSPDCGAFDLSCEPADEPVTAAETKLTISSVAGLDALLIDSPVTLAAIVRSN